ALDLAVGSSGLRQDCQHVIGRLAALPLRYAERVVPDPGERLEPLRRLRGKALVEGRDEGVGPLVELLSVLLGNTEDLANRRRRQGVGDLLDEVEGPLLDRSLHQLDGDLPEPRLEALERGGAEGAPDLVAALLMDLTVLAEDPGAFGRVHRAEDADHR